jgi:signal transduction histidine kinase
MPSISAPELQSANPLRILYLTDKEGEADLLRMVIDQSELSVNFLELELVTVDGAGKLAAEVAHGEANVIITDLLLSWGDVSEIIPPLRECSSDAILILFSSIDWTKAQVDISGLGADAILAKSPSNFMLVPSAIQKALHSAHSSDVHPQVPNILMGLNESKLIGVFEANFDGRVITANHTFNRLMKLENWDSKLPLNLHEFSVQTGEISKLLSNLSRDGRIAVENLQLRDRQGEAVRVNLQLAVRVEIDGTQIIDGLIWPTTAAIADGKEAEELSLRVKDLEATKDELEKLTSMTTHELREPVRTITRYTQRIIDKYGDQLNGSSQQWMDYIRQGTDKLQSLVDDLLNYSKMAGVSKESFEIVDLNLVLAKVQSLLAASIEESLALITHDLLPTIQANPDAIESVFLNLIGNAIKYRSDQRPEILISAQEDTGTWTIKIQDNGIGISPEFHHDIFQLFRRLHASDEISGTGVGLALCQKIIQQHGGDIRVESLPGQGSIFIFTLPSGEPTQPTPLARSSYIST